MTLLENLIYDPSRPECCRYDLFLPCNIGGTCENLFVYFHGGGLEGGDKAYERPVFSLLCEQYGIACASVNYRMYPDGARFPDYIEDCAKAVSVIMTEGKQYCRFRHITVGGSSAGGYLSMMLFFDPRYLGAYGIHPNTIDNCYFDAGQPTTHFNILAKERGLDPTAVRIDEAAPMYFADHPYTDTEALPRLHFTWAEHDMTARPEQNELMVCLLRHYGYPAEKLSTTWMAGNRHCEYVGNAPVFAKMIADFMKQI
ncbi:MAG: alpha/beta hydrolase [Eubacteriales bacterium]